MIGHSKLSSRSESSNPDDNFVKPRKEDTCGQSKKHETHKVSRPMTSLSPTDSSSSDSIWEADKLISSIDKIDRKFGSQTKTKQEAATATANSLLQRPVPIHNVGTFHKHIPAHEQSPSKNGSSASKKKSETTSEVNVIDSTGEIDLDALEKWASTSNSQINWLNKKDVITTKDILPPSVTKVAAEKMSQSDIAVKEIDAILDTLTETKDVTESHCKITSDAKNVLTLGQKATAPPSPCFSNDFSMQTMTWSQPLSAIRLPPLKGSTVVNEDIFHRKLKDMSLLHVPHTLPKLEQSGQKQTESIQQCIKQSPSRLPGKAPVESFITRSSNHDVDILLPGQASGVNSEVASKQMIPVRTIILDYSSTSNDKNEKKSRTSRGQKLRKLFSCCQAAQDEGKVYEFDAEKNSSKASFEEIQIAIVEEAAQRSLPRRMWARLKSIFGR